MYVVSDNSGGNGGNIVNYDYSAYEKNNYTAKPPTFSGDSTDFEWWKSKMHTHIISVDDELWDILEDDIDIPADGVEMVAGRKRRSIENIIECVAFW